AGRGGGGVGGRFGGRRAARRDLPAPDQHHSPLPPEFHELGVRTGVKAPPTLMHLRHRTPSEQEPVGPLVRGVEPRGSGSVWGAESRSNRVKHGYRARGSRPSGPSGSVARAVASPARAGSREGWSRTPGASDRAGAARGAG